MSRIRFLLLQTRNSDDPMREQEVRCFTRALQCDAGDITVVDFLSRGPTAAELNRTDLVLLGGSGHYSAASEPGRGHQREALVGPRSWLDRALDILRDVHRQSKPTFASCWGFQAMSRAMGGQCVHDPAHAELGTIDLRLTAAGQTDPLFGTLPAAFGGQAGHEDHVTELPADAVLLASSDRVRHQAFRFVGKPIYCTQFHPELDRTALSERMRAYPEYVERIAGVPFEAFIENCRETPDANLLLRRFVGLFFAE